MEEESGSRWGHLNLRNGVQAVALIVRRSPALMATAAASVLVLSPFLAAAAAILTIGVLCCLPVILTAGTVSAIVWLGPRAGELARFWSAEVLLLFSRARTSPIGVSLESRLRANPLLAAAALCCTPILVPAGFFAAATVSVLAILSLPLLVPGACILLANHEFRRTVWRLSQRAAARMFETLDWQPSPVDTRTSPPATAVTVGPAQALSEGVDPQPASSGGAPLVKDEEEGPEKDGDAAPESAVACPQLEAAPVEAAPSTPPPQARGEASASSGSPACKVRLQTSREMPGTSSPASARSEASSTHSATPITPGDRGGHARVPKSRAKKRQSAGLAPTLAGAPRSRAGVPGQETDASNQ